MLRGEKSLMGPLTTSWLLLSRLLPNSDSPIDALSSAVYNNKYSVTYTSRRVDSLGLELVCDNRGQHLELRVVVLIVVLDASVQISLHV